MKLCMLTTIIEGRATQLKHTTNKTEVSDAVMFAIHWLPECNSPKAQQRLYNFFGKKAEEHKLSSLAETCFANAKTNLESQLKRN